MYLGMLMQAYTNTTIERNYMNTVSNTKTCHFGSAHRLYTGTRTEGQSFSGKEDSENSRSGKINVVPRRSQSRPAQPSQIRKSLRSFAHG